MQSKFFYLLILSNLLFCSLQAQTTVFKDVSVITMNSDKLLSNQDVVVENGIIKSIQRSSNKSYGKAVVVLSSGKFLMPGLADMHVHLPRKETYGYNVDSFLKLNLAAGVTAIRSMRGDQADPQLQREIQAGKRLSPDLYISAPAFSTRYWVSSDSLTRLVHRHKKEGFQLLKVLSIPSASWFDTLAMIARQENIRLAGHAPNGVSIVHALNQGLGCVEHLGGYESLPTQDSSFQEALQQTLNNNVYNCPTLDWYFVAYTQIPLDSLKRRSGLDRLPSAAVKNWSQTFENYLAKQNQRNSDSLRQEQESERKYIAHKLEVLQKLYQSGCQLLISPDASGMFQVPGLALIEEMKHYRQAGIPEYAILKAATINAAAYFGESDQWGTVEAGKRANLILLNKNPLSDIQHVGSLAGVMVRGQWLSEADLNKIIENCKHQYHE
jgi:hypothetical protein